MTKQPKQPSETTALAQIDAIVREHNIASLDQLPGEMVRAITLSRGMNQLRQLVAGPILADICALAGTPLGFKTDKDNAGGYPKETIRDVVIEGMLLGARPIGNEINIIAGRLYLTKEYFEHQLRGLVSKMRVRVGIPCKTNEGALIPMAASWEFEGVADSIECRKTDSEDTRIWVRVNAGMGADAVIGKGKRKLFERIHSRVTGSTWCADDPDDVPSAAVLVEAKPAAEPEGDDWVDDFTSELAMYGRLIDVSAYASEMCQRATPEQKVAILAACERRREEIRDSRGERSNEHKDA